MRGRSLCLSSISYVTELPLRFMKVRRRPETIFRVGLLDRQSEVRFCVWFLGCFAGTDGTVRFRRRKMFFLLSVWFHGCSNLTQDIFR